MNEYTRRWILSIILISNCCYLIIVNYSLDQI